MAAIEQDPEMAGLALRSVADAMRAEFASGVYSGCEHFTGEENYCRDGSHGVAKDQGEGQFLHVQKTGACPVAAGKEAIRRRREILADCELVIKIGAKYGVSFDVQRPLWMQLLGAMDGGRPVLWSADGKAQKPLKLLLDKIELGCRQPNKQAPHLLLQGPCGTGKTTLQAVLYLAACEAGLAAAFVDSIDLRFLATNLNSRYTPTVEAADRRMAWLVSRDVIFWSDVGDTHATRHEFAETVTALLERFTGRLVLSSNLTPEQLSEHADIQKRAVSRMFAGRHGKSSIWIQLVGPDQRTSGSQLQTVFEL